MDEQTADSPPVGDANAPGEPQPPTTPYPDPASTAVAKNDAAFPTVGRVVHYWPPEYEVPVAAIVVYVWSRDLVNLYVLPTGIGGDVSAGVVTSVEYGEGGAGPARRWCWPPRV